ncbi:MAG: NAD(P)H-hydrate epimerase, partial [Bacteroidota bacterium]|nr:NAD(P)H-hydrate epimerase [Bacteroidota bacterium]
MNILSAEQIREWDRYTIQHEPVLSIDLMERAARACVNWIVVRKLEPAVFRIFCGKGNNGGDGLAIGRLLLQKGYKVSFYILEFGKPGSEDFQGNLQRLHHLPAPDIHFIQEKIHFPSIHPNDLIIDALFGSGFNKPLRSLAADLIIHLNTSDAPIIAIDLPSGLFMEQSSKENAVVSAKYTLTFQCYKTALLLQENAPYVGDVQVLDIGLHPAYLDGISATDTFLDEKMVRRLFRSRQRFSHKGNFGHALLA